MSELLHLQNIFDHLRRGHHLSSDDEPEFSALMANYDGYAAHFAPLGLVLVKHQRDFFYFAPDVGDNQSDGLPRIAVFSYILVDHAANSGRSLEDFFFNQHFFISHLPHFSLDRYSTLLRQVEVRDFAGLRKILHNMKQFNWIRFVGASNDEFRFLRPFCRMLDKCIDICEEHAGQCAGGDQEGNFAP